MAQWQLAELASKAGELLGMGLDLTWDGHGVRIGTEGNGLYLSEPYDQRGRVRLSGWFPVTSCRESGRHHITVRADRGPKAIAAEADRRLLPGYRAAMAKVREYDAREKAMQQARDTLTAYVRGLFPGGATYMPAHCQSDARAEVIVRLGKDLQGGCVRISHDGSEVEFERFRVPAAVALRMLETSALLISTQPC